MQTSDLILSTKRAVLSSGGVSYNDLMYSMANSSVSLLECTFQWNQLLSLPSLQFGSSSTINVPNDQFADTIVLHLTLPQLQANETLCRGWGYNILQSVSWTMGSSNSTQIMLQNDAILQTILGQIIDPEKRLEVLRQGGDEYLLPPTAPIGGDVPKIEAYVLIPLPFSTMCDKLPVDTSMLQNNINIQIQFKNNPSCIYGGSATHPTAFLNAELMLRMGKLSDQSKSVRGAMIMQPNLKYAYPFIHSQYYSTAIFQGRRESDGGKVEVDLNTFSNADLVAICFWVIAEKDKTPLNNSTPNPFNCDDISNIVVTYAGQTIYNYPSKSYKMTNMLTGGEQSASYFPYSVVNSGNTTPFLSFPKNCYPIWLDFSRLRSTCIHSHLFNTWRLTNQTLRVSFNTSLGNATDYRLHATYFYNGVIEFQNGTSAVYID